jgi:flavin-dependent dehydrogenase
VLLAATSLLEPVAGRGWLAVGDAASCFDPISAQGIHKAFANAIAAAEVIACGNDTGETRTQSYQAQIHHDFENYLRVRQHFYDIEKRWPLSSFWADRQRPVTLPPSRAFASSRSLVTADAPEAIGDAFA